MPVRLRQGRMHRIDPMINIYNSWRVMIAVLMVMIIVLVMIAVMVSSLADVKVA